MEAGKILLIAVTYTKSKQRVEYPYKPTGDSVKLSVENFNRKFLLEIMGMVCRSLKGAATLELFPKEGKALIYNDSDEEVAEGVVILREIAEPKPETVNSSAHS